MVSDAFGLADFEIWTLVVMWVEGVDGISRIGSLESGVDVSESCYGCLDWSDDGK